MFQDHRGDHFQDYVNGEEDKDEEPSLRMVLMMKLRFLRFQIMSKMLRQKFKVSHYFHSATLIKRIISNFVKEYLQNVLSR